MMQLLKNRWLSVALVACVMGTSAVAFAQDEGEEQAYEPTFGVGVDLGFFFTDMGRFNSYILEPNQSDLFDVHGSQHIDLVVESKVFENFRLSLFGGVTTPWVREPSLLGWYVGLEPAYVAGDDTWEMAVGVSAGVGSLGIKTSDAEEMKASLTVLRPFLEVRRLFDTRAAIYLRGGFNQWYLRNPRSDDLDLTAPGARRELAGVDLATGGIYLALGARFGTLYRPVAELEPEPEPEPECREESVDVDCPDIPEATCEEGTLTSYGAVCDDGECSYVESAVVCGQGMECGEIEGEPACVETPECGSDGDCIEVPPMTCVDGEIITYGGVCQDETCVYIASAEPCPEGTRCGIEGGKVACVEEPEEIVVEVDEEENRIEIKDVIHFGHNSAEIEDRSSPLLNQIARVLNENPQVERVRIEGHTDDQGRAEYNMDLSKRRAESVREALIERGVHPDRLEAEGFGMTRPLVQGTSDSARAQNRRVEMHIVELEKEAPEEPDAADEAVEESAGEDEAPAEGDVEEAESEEN